MPLDFAAIGKVIVEVGVLPGTIAALLFFIYKLITENNKSIVALTTALSENTGALNMLTEYVKGKSS